MYKIFSHWQSYDNCKFISYELSNKKSWIGIFSMPKKYYIYYSLFFSNYLSALGIDLSVKYFETIDDAKIFAERQLKDVGAVMADEKLDIYI